MNGVVSSKITNVITMLLIIIVPVYLVLISSSTGLWHNIFGTRANIMPTEEPVNEGSSFGAKSYIVAGQRINPSIQQQQNEQDLLNQQQNDLLAKDGIVSTEQQNMQSPLTPKTTEVNNKDNQQASKQPENQTQTNSVATQPIPAVPPNAIDKILQEGHWIGLEAIPLTSNIAMANNIPANIVGVLIDEVTLLAAQSGILAGDVITAVGDKKVTDLKSFQEATKQIANLTQSNITVYRQGKDIIIEIKSNDVLGMAQMEAAPTILATDKAPHGYYGPCDKCHTIVKTNKNLTNLPKDAGDVLSTTAPPITWGAIAPHRDRGLCTNCHNIKT
ncbi:MAG: magnetochrome domain-containing protein [Nitrospinae bacterium]|nr:magnetochrome domain-containing protein [Nitrospinota bacterium]